MVNGGSEGTDGRRGGGARRALLRVFGKRHRKHLEIIVPGHLEDGHGVLRVRLSVFLSLGLKREFDTLVDIHFEDHMGCTKRIGASDFFIEVHDWQVGSVLRADGDDQGVPELYTTHFVLGHFGFGHDVETSHIERLLW